MNRKRKGFTLVELLVVIAIIALLMGILMPALARVRQIAFRMVCGSNLSGIGRAMLIYTNDYDYDLPRAGYTGTPWRDQVPNWSGADRAIAYTGSTPFSGNPGQATISSSLYLLVKFAEVTPKSYICKGESTRKAFKASDYQAQSTILNIEDEEAWDFGPTNLASGLSPTNHCSYSYHMPYNRRFLSLASSEPGMAIAADRNPWLDPDTDTTGFVWNSYARTPGPEIIKQFQKGNAGPHQREGQNVLFMDNHVYFENQSFCGIDEDNIYTYDPGSRPPDIQRGAEFTFCISGTYDETQPVFAKDSVLVNECGIGGGTTTTTTTTTTTKTGGPGCFPADTPVWIDGEQVQISKVAAGQKVGSLDATHAESCLKKPDCLKEIESILEYQGSYDYYNIVLENGNRINVVHSHYFLTASDQWVLVENLKVGSKLKSLKGTISIKTISKREVPFTDRFYNLKIKGGDRYFVGKDGVTVRGH